MEAILFSSESKLSLSTIETNIATAWAKAVYFDGISDGIAFLEKINRFKFNGLDGSLIIGGIISPPPLCSWLREAP
jgi:hypothetical protein